MSGLVVLIQVVAASPPLVKMPMPFKSAVVPGVPGFPGG